MSKLVVSLLLILTIFIQFPTQVLAADDECDKSGIHIKLLDNKLRFDQNEKIKVGINFDKEAAEKLDPNSFYYIEFKSQDQWLQNLTARTQPSFKGVAQDLYNKTITSEGNLANIGRYVLELHRETRNVLSVDLVCKGPSIEILPGGFGQLKCDLKIPQKVKYNSRPTVEVSYQPINQDIRYTVDIYKSKKAITDFYLQRNIFWTGPDYPTIDLAGKTSIQLPNFTTMGDHTAVLVASKSVGWTNPLLNTYVYNYGCAISNFSVVQTDTSSEIAPSQQAAGAGATETQRVNRGNSLRYEGPFSAAAGQPCESGVGIKTAIGCVPTNPIDFIQAFFRLSIGIGGGIAFLMMVFGAFQMVASAGNPEALKAGQQRFTSAIYGLLFIVFAIFLLEVIGVDILGLEGIGR